MKDSPQAEAVDYRIQSAREGYEVLLRNKSAITKKDSDDQNPVLFVHGATYGATDTFDYRIGGYSWMDMLAQQGFDVWCLDILGYGQSDRPREMREDPENNPPLSDTEHAVLEIHQAVSFILDRRLLCGTLSGAGGTSAIIRSALDRGRIVVTREGFNAPGHWRL